MPCRVNWTSEKLHVSLFLTEILFSFEKNLSLRHQKEIPSLVLSTQSVTWNEV